MERIGFIGLGNMGKPMAVNLIKAGFQMTVYDVNPEPVAELVTLGASQADSPAEVARRSDIVASVVMNDRQTRDVMFGPDGVLSTMPSGGVIVLHSTLSVPVCEEVAAAAAEKGIEVLDAAVSGASERSAAGTLSIMVGGSEETAARCQPLFDVVGEKTYHMGRLGMGQTAKVCNNLMCLVNVHVIEEGLRLARDAGIEEGRMREVAESSSGDSWALRNIDNMRELAGIHTGGNVDMSIFGRKDISLAVKLAQQMDSPTPITNFVFDQTKH